MVGESIVAVLAESTDRSSMLARGFMGRSACLRGEESVDKWRGAASLDMCLFLEVVGVLVGVTVLVGVAVMPGVAVLVVLLGLAS